MNNKNQKRGSSLSDKGNKNFVDAKKSKIENHHKEEQLYFLQVCSKNGHEKKSNEIAIKQLESNKEVSKQGMKLLIYFKLKFILNSLLKNI